MPVSSSFPYKPALDGLRGIAVLLVMAAHLGLVLAGGLGVDVFFVLSGYLITALLVAEFSATEQVSLKRFYIRRALRLLPALFLLLIVYNLYVGISHSRHEGSTARWESLAAVFYIANWLRAFGHDIGSLGHLWSLSIEEQFYLLWPIVLVLLWKGRRTNRQIMVLIGIAILVINLDRLFLYNGLASFPRIYNGTDTRLDTLLVGCALGLSGCGGLRPNTLVIAGVIAAIYLAYIIVFGCPLFYCLTFGFTVFAIGSALVIAAILSSSTSISARFLGFPPLAWTGRLYYGLYLWHYPVFAFTPGWLPPSNRIVGISTKVLLTFACAALSYYMLEKPCLDIKKRFTALKD